MLIVGALFAAETPLTTESTRRNLSRWKWHLWAHQKVGECERETRQPHTAYVVGWKPPLSFSLCCEHLIVTQQRARMRSGGGMRA